VSVRGNQFFFPMSYDFVDVFVDLRDFQYCVMDTDTAYIAFSADTLEEVIKPNLRQLYDIGKKNWFPRTDTPEHTAYDKTFRFE
jgi:hypothetical protein